MLEQHVNKPHKRLCCMYCSVSLGRSGLFEASLWEWREQFSDRAATWINSASFWPTMPISEVGERRRSQHQEGKIEFQITFLHEVSLYGI